MGHEITKYDRVRKPRPDQRRRPDTMHGDQTQMAEYFGSRAVMRGCAGKVAYPSKRHAQAIAGRMRRQGQAGPSFGAYRCAGKAFKGLGCGRWHVGHRVRSDKPQEEL